jgi:hypothetical protein
LLPRGAAGSVASALVHGYSAATLAATLSLVAAGLVSLVLINARPRAAA